MSGEVSSGKERGFSAIRRRRVGRTTIECTQRA